MNTATLPVTQASTKTFYPTPKPLIDELLTGIDWPLVETVLEPSAGKGDIALAVIEKLKAHSRRYGYGADTESFDVDCVEIDPDLRHILSGRKLRVVHDDFLTIRTFKRYSAIIMNPPFDRGAEHLLKALEMQRNGGYIACILNAETLNNPFSLARKQLKGLLEQYGALISYKDNAFVSAERRTGVRIAIIKVTIPFEQEPESIILEGLRADKAKRRREEPNQHNDLIKDDYIEAIVDRFGFEVEAGCRLIQEYRALQPYLTDTVAKEDHPSPLLSVIMGSVYSHRQETATENAYIRGMRKKYWTALFTNRQFIQSMTSNLQEDLMASVEKLKDFDFTVYNIMTIRLNMQKKLADGIHQTIMKLFDDWTCKHHWDENSKNRHYFDGWRTNDAFAVNKRVIIPFYSEAFDSWNGRFHPTHYSTEKTLCDIEKVFDYLSGSKPDYEGLHRRMDAAEKTVLSRGIELQYFKVTFFKKGTCHIEFTDLDVLHKFNLYAARDKKWLPPCYGRKGYQEMDAEEKKVVDAFEGEESYERVLRRKEYFLAEPVEQGLVMLGGGERSA